MSSERTLRRGVQSAGRDLGILEDDAEAARPARPSPSDLERAADPAVDQVAHGEADVRFVGGDPGRDQAVAQRGRVGGVATSMRDDGLARRGVTRSVGGLPAAPSARARSGVLSARRRSAGPGGGRGPGTAGRPRAGRRGGRRAARLDAIRRLEDEAAVGRRDYFASGSGRSWNFTTLLVVPLPPSMWNGARVLTVAQSPRPFQPAFGSSMRPSIHLV